MSCAPVRRGVLSQVGRRDLGDLNGFSKRLILIASALLMVSPFLMVTGIMDLTTGQSPGEIPASTLSITTPTIQTSPSREHVLVGEQVTFYINATSDIVGTTLNFTIYFDYYLADGSVNPDSPVVHVTTGNPGAVEEYYTYYTVGNCTTYPVEDDDSYYVIRVEVDDGVSPPAAPGYLLLWVFDNTAPYFTLAPPASLSVDWGEEVAVSFTVADYDDDPLEAVWDFGDGTPLGANSTDASLLPVTFTQVHAWAPVVDPGDAAESYLCVAEIEVADDQGNLLYATMEVMVTLPHNYSPVGAISVEKKLVDPTEALPVYASVRDLEGDAITWTYEVRNDTEVRDLLVYHTPASTPNSTVWNNITYTFGIIGNYTITLYFSDAVDPALQTGAHNKSVSVSGIICSNNSLPYVHNWIMAVPESPELNETTWTTEVMFYIDIADADGDSVTIVWDFGDGSSTVTNTSADGALVRCSQLHVYDAAGTYNVSTVATDGWAGHEVLRWRTINVTSNNTAPTIVSFDILHTNRSYSMPGSSVGFVIVFMDREFDPINLTIEFGDDTDGMSFYLNDFNETGCVEVTFNHTYDVVGEYSLYINFTDNLFGTASHDAQWVALVSIDVYVPDVLRVWDIWDYVGLALVFGLVASLIGLMVMNQRKRKALDRMGLTWEEYSIRKGELRTSQSDLDVKGDEGGDAR